MELSWGAILRLVLVFFAAYLVFLVQEILILAVFGLVIAMLFEGPIKKLSRFTSRPLATVFLYVATFALLSFLIYLPISSLVEEIKDFLNLFPVYFEQVSPPLRRLGFDAFKDIETFTTYLEELAGVLRSNILNVFFSFFGGLASTVFVLSIALFISLEGKEIEDALVVAFPERKRKWVKKVWDRAEKRVGFWFFKIIIGCIFLGVTSYTSFLLIGIDYPLSLGVLAGIADFIPMIGPAVSSIAIFMIVSLDSLPRAILAVAVYFILQQIENNIIGPLLTKKLVGLSPVLVLVSLAVGGKLFGLLGSILMVPLVGIIVEFVKAFSKSEESERIEVEKI